MFDTKISVYVYYTVYALFTKSAINGKMRQSHEDILSWSKSFGEINCRSFIRNMVISYYFIWMYWI